LVPAYPPAPLERKAKAIGIPLGGPEEGYEPHRIRTTYTSADRQQVNRTSSWFVGSCRGWKAVFKKTLTRPFIFLARELIIQMVGLYVLFAYGLHYISLTTLPAIFPGAYQDSPGIAGLNYIALGIGITGASQVSAIVTDRLYTRIWRKYGTGKPTFRLCEPLLRFPLSNINPQATRKWPSTLRMSSYRPRRNFNVEPGPFISLN
jgi:hypothetical protein